MTLVNSFIDTTKKNPIFTDGYCDFSGLKNVLNKKRKYNYKYHVYNKEKMSPITLKRAKPMTVLEVIRIRSKKESIIIYVDSRKKVSFVRTKQTNLTEKDIIHKIEKTPFYRNVVIPFLYWFIFFGVMRFRDYSFLEAQMSLGYDKTINYKIHYIFPKHLRERFSLSTNMFTLLLHSYIVFIPMKELYQYYLRKSDINIPVYIRLVNPTIDYIYPMKSNFRHKYDKEHYIYNTVSYRLKKQNAELFIRKSIVGQYVIVFTSVMSKWIVWKEAVAYAFSLLSFNKERYTIYFEKFSEGASESAFELFKYAHSREENCIYILDKNHPHFAELKQTFGDSLVAKNSFMAFYYIFLGKSFISSDLVSHIQRRLYDNDRLIKRKILSCDKKIFLQHGVALATNIFERGYFNRKVPIAPDYIIVNSLFEKNLFLEYTNYKKDELILTGLPNLDLYAKEVNNPKDEITFLLTWRPWDLTGSIENGSYLDRYLSFMNLIQNESFYQDKKINVILHPKSRIILKEQFPLVYDKYQSLFYEGDIKDALLRSKVLISDYSSVVYYAFAGGSNVVFYWEDKEKAEKEYGAPNILQEKIAFGDITYAIADLHEIIVNNYLNVQSDSHKNKYNRLVECTNGDNTQRTYNYIQTSILYDNNYANHQNQSIQTIEVK